MPDPQRTVSTEPPLKPSRRALLVQTLATFAIAAIGGKMFTLLGLPASWLSGAAIAVAIAVLAGAPLHFPDRLRDIVFIVLGMSIGSAVTPDTLAGIGRWPASILFLLVSLALTTLLVQSFFVRLARWDRVSALLAAMPGAMSQVLAIAMESNADTARVAVAQIIRVFILVALLPSLIAAGGHGAAVDRGPATAADLALATVVAVAAALLCVRIRMPAGALTGSLIASATLNGTGLVTAPLPQPVQVIAFIAVGGMVGFRFKGISLATIGRLAGVSLGAFVLAMAASLAAALLVSQVVDVPFAEALVAFAPGGLDAMMALAFALGLDPAYVGVHHLTRYLVIALLLPAVIARFQRS